MVTWMSSHFPSFRSTFSSGEEQESSFSFRPSPFLQLFDGIWPSQETAGTVIDGKAKLLYDGQIPTDSVQTINVQPWGGVSQKTDQLSLGPRTRLQPSREALNLSSGTQMVAGQTCALNVVDARADEVGHCGVLPMAEAGQAAAKYLICGKTQRVQTQKCHKTERSPRVCHSQRPRKLKAAARHLRDSKITRPLGLNSRVMSQTSINQGTRGDHYFTKYKLCRSKLGHTHHRVLLISFHSRFRFFWGSFEHEEHFHLLVSGNEAFGVIEWVPPPCLTIQQL